VNSSTNNAICDLMAEHGQLTREVVQLRAEVEQLTTAIAELGVTPEEARAGVERSKALRAQLATAREDALREAATTAYRKLYRWGHGPSLAAKIERVLLDLAAIPSEPAKETK